MGSTSKQTKAVKRLASIALNGNGSGAGGGVGGGAGASGFSLSPSSTDHVPPPQKKKKQQSSPSSASAAAAFGGGANGGVNGGANGGAGAVPVVGVRPIPTFTTHNCCSSRGGREEGNSDDDASEFESEGEDEEEGEGHESGGGRGRGGEAGAAASCFDANAAGEEDEEDGESLLEEDETLKQSQTLSVEEVVKRRLKAIQQLTKLYRGQYWGLLEEVRTKYRRFYLRTGKSGWRDDNVEPEENGSEAKAEAEAGPEAADAAGHVNGVGDRDGDADGGTGREGPVERRGGGGGGRGGGARGSRSSSFLEELNYCSAPDCTAKPMALSVFCFTHILMEPRQRLYKPCSYVIRVGAESGAGAGITGAEPSKSLAGGSTSTTMTKTTTCGKPVLRSVVPPLCAPHFKAAEKQANRSVNKVLPGGVKFNPKLHLIISQYVKVIQSNRRKGKAARLASAAAAASAPPLAPAAALGAAVAGAVQVKANGANRANRANGANGANGASGANGIKEAVLQAGAGGEEQGRGEGAGSSTGGDLGGDCGSSSKAAHGEKKVILDRVKREVEPPSV